MVGGMVVDSNLSGFQSHILISSLTYMFSLIIHWPDALILYVTAIMDQSFHFFLVGGIDMGLSDTGLDQGSRRVPEVQLFKFIVCVSHY